MVSSPESYTMAVKLLSVSTVIIHLRLLVLNLSFPTHLLHVLAIASNIAFTIIIIIIFIFIIVV
jgi:hypothetical protein